MAEFVEGGISSILFSPMNSPNFSDENHAFTQAAEFQLHSSVMKLSCIIVLFM
jgi:hypothetical protein